MLDWVPLSVLSACMSSVWSLTVKAGLEKVQAASFTAWYSAGAAVILAAVISLTGGKVGLNFWGSVAGLFAGIASVGLAKSFALSPNPGFSMGVFRMQAVVTALASYLFFKAPLDRIKVIGMLVACVGVALLARSTKHAEAFQVGGTKKAARKPAKKQDGLHWLWLASGAGVMMSVKDLATKHALTAAGGSIAPTLLSCSVGQVLVTMLAAYYLEGGLGLEPVKGGSAPQDYKWYAAAAAGAFALYQGTVIAASKAAPNVGIVKAIDSLGLVLTTLGSHFLYGSSLGGRSLESVGVILLGVIIMCFSKTETEWWNALGRSARAGLCREHGMCRAKGYDFRLLDTIMGWSAPA